MNSLRSHIRPPRGSVGLRLISTKSCDPLRILFCGSEDFSIASLQALHNEHTSQPNSIASIDVVCRPDKRVGRGLKHIREVPIKAVAKSLNLNVHEIDTFTGWHPPRPEHEPINLIVAVSFGLLVPPRILKGAKYGGLNVHPSLLPDFRGPAPLHHTLLAGCKNTGITLQTLHPKHFDHGTILAQTPLPGFSIPVPGASPECFSVAELLHLVAPKGAEMLVQGIRDQVFVEPTVDMGWHQGSEDPPSVRRAPKITSEDSHIDWKTWTSKEILRREAVLGPLWNKFTITSDPSHVHTSRAAMKRIILSGFEHLEAYGKARRGPFQPGVAFTPEASRPGFYVATCDGEMMAINRMKIEGEVEKQALAAHSTLGLV